MSRQTLDRQHRLLHSASWERSPRAVLIVTGIPEGPNELAQSEHSDLGSLFARADEETAVVVKPRRHGPPPEELWPDAG